MDFTSAISHSTSRPLQHEVYIPPVSGNRIRHEPVIDVTSFSDDGFADFTLDLTCMSPPGSPSGRTVSMSSSHVLFSSPPSPRPLSLLSENPSTSHLQSKERPTSQDGRKLSSTTSASVIHGSWPVTRFTGRGTPIDRSRRSEWGSTNGEDGIIFSTSASLDSDNRTDPGVGAPPNWFSSLQTQHDLEPVLLPEPSKVEMQPLSSDWDSVMHTVLESSGSSSALPRKGDDSAEQKGLDGTIDLSGVEMDLRLDASLDLGLGNGTSWYETGIPSGRAASSAGGSPSAYSTPPESPIQSQSECGSQLDDTVVVERPPENVGPIQKDEVHPKKDQEPGHWWHRIFIRFRKVKKVLKSHRSCV
ncbi:hypothetical protein C8J56DRAFT_203370 [Mycena floridula]|nr:hypothetical protein C8J56DRAFT_203370 [Mycena floridula]